MHSGRGELRWFMRGGACGVRGNKLLLRTARLICTKIGGFLRTNASMKSLRIFYNCFAGFVVEFPPPDTQPPPEKAPMQNFARLFPLFALAAATARAQDPATLVDRSYPVLPPIQEAYRLPACLHRIVYTLASPLHTPVFMDGIEAESTSPLGQGYLSSD